MTDPFGNAKFSIRRAKRNLEDFDAHAAEHIAGERLHCSHRVQRKDETQEFKIKFVRDFPEDLRGHASDAIKNIRDSLDQAMSAASSVVPGKRRKRAHFPFGESADNIEDCLSRRKSRFHEDIPEEPFPAIRPMRPYPHEGDNFRLKLLGKVSGPHKHSVSLILGSAPPYPFAQVGFIGTESNVLASVNFLSGTARKTR